MNVVIGCRVLARAGWLSQGLPGSPLPLGGRSLDATERVGAGVSSCPTPARVRWKRSSAVWDVPPAGGGVRGWVAALGIAASERARVPEPSALGSGSCDDNSQPKEWSSRLPGCLIQPSTGNGSGRPPGRDWEDDRPQEGPPLLRREGLPSARSHTRPESGAAGGSLAPTQHGQLVMRLVMPLPSLDPTAFSVRDSIAPGDMDGPFLPQ